MGTLTDKHTQRITNSACEVMFQKFLTLLDVDRLYLDIDTFAKLHSVSRSSIEKAIQAKMITEENGGLKKGSGSRNNQKYIYRFFNHLTGRVEFPRLS